MLNRLLAYLGFKPAPQPAPEPAPRFPTWESWVDREPTPEPKPRAVEKNTLLLPLVVACGEEMLIQFHGTNGAVIAGLFCQERRQFLAQIHAADSQRRN